MYKNEEVYESEDGVCYVPELSDTAYTHQDFLNMCNGQPEIADRVFEAVDWQHPESYLEELWMYDEPELAECSCGKWYWCYGVDRCPHCGAVKNGEQSSREEMDMQGYCCTNKSQARRLFFSEIKKGEKLKRIVKVKE